MEPTTSEVVRNLFPRKPDTFQAIKKHMKEKGFSKAHPIIVARGPWTEFPVIIDGYCRYDAANDLEIEPVFDVSGRQIRRNDTRNSDLRLTFNILNTET